LHEIKVTLQVNIAIPEDKKVTVGNIATSIRELEIESRITEQIIQTVDEKTVDELCSCKYARGNGEQQYQRAGTNFLDNL
jgi:hypothetical protein